MKIEIDTNELILGNFLDKFDFINLKNKSIIITDPPYNIGFKYNEHDDNMSDEAYVDMIANFQNTPSVFIHYPIETMKYLIPALGIPDYVMSWCYNSNLPKQFRLINFFNCKPNKSKVLQEYKNKTDKRVKKLIEAGKKGTPIYDWFSDIQIVKNVSKEKTGHPCPIPEKLIERIILMTTNEGDTVIDPFMGSGTVPFVAKKLGRSFIGIEKNKEYFEMAKKRIFGS